MKKSRRKNDIKFPIITYKDSENNSFEYQPDEWEIEELLEELIGENTTQDKEGLVYINNDENYTCSEDCYEEQLANYIAERVKELFISYYDQIKERFQGQAMNYHNELNEVPIYEEMAEDDLLYDSKLPEFGRKVVNFDTEDINIDGDFSNTSTVANLAKEYGIDIDKLADGSFRGEKELVINNGTFENIINLFRGLGVIDSGEEIAVDIYYDAGDEIYTLDQVLNKAEKANVYLASYIFEEDKDFIQVVGTPENINKFMEDVVTNYDVAVENDKQGEKSLKPSYYPYNFTIELRKDIITDLRNQPLKFKSDKYLGEKDEETMKNLEELYKEYSEDTIDDITTPYGDFAASLKPLFGGKYTIKFHKEPYLTTNIGVYDSVYNAWKACFLFAITYGGDLDAFKEDDFYKENNIEEEEEQLGEGERRNLQEKRSGNKYIFKGSNGLPYQVRLYTRQNNWLCEGKNQLNGETVVLGSLKANEFSQEEALRYCELAYNTWKSLDFDKDAFRQSEVYNNMKEIAKGEVSPEQPIEEDKDNKIYTFEYNAFLNDPFNEEFTNEKEFRNLANRLNVNVLQFNLGEDEKEATFKVSGLKKNILNFIDVLFDFDFDNEEEEIEYLVNEGYLKTN